jgi:hypothetical protein
MGVNNENTGLLATELPFFLQSLKFVRADVFGPSSPGCFGGDKPQIRLLVLY